MTHRSLALALSLCTGLAFAQGLPAPPLGQTTFRTLDRTTRQADGTQTRLWINGEGRFRILDGSSPPVILADGDLSADQLQRVRTLVHSLRASEVTGAPAPPLAHAYSVTVDANDALGGTFAGEADRLTPAEANERMRELDALETELRTAPTAPAPVIPDGFRSHRGKFTKDGLHVYFTDWFDDRHKVVTQGAEELFGPLVGKDRVEIIGKRDVGIFGADDTMDVHRVVSPLRYTVFGELVSTGSNTYELHVGPTSERRKLELVTSWKTDSLLEELVGREVSVVGYQLGFDSELSVVGIEGRATANASIKSFGSSPKPLATGSQLLLTFAGTDEFSVLTGDEDGYVPMTHVELVRRPVQIPLGLETSPLTPDPAPGGGGITDQLAPSEILSGELAGSGFSLRTASETLRLTGMNDDDRNDLVDLLPAGTTVQLRGRRTADGFVVLGILSPLKTRLLGTYYNDVPGARLETGTEVVHGLPRIQGLWKQRLVFVGWREAHGAKRFFSRGFLAKATRNAPVSVKIGVLPAISLPIVRGTVQLVVGRENATTLKIRYATSTGTIAEDALAPLRD